MEWENIAGRFVLNFDPIFTSAIASFMFLFGTRLRQRVAFFRKYCVPPGVVGGLTVALVAFALHAPGLASINFDLSLQVPMIAIFFTRVGLGGSFDAFKRGGKELVIYLFFCWLLALFQNAVGVGLAKWLNFSPLLGIMAGAVSLEGGHNLAVVFGPLAESLGASGALAVAVAAATFGLITGGLMGAPVAHWLIRSYQLPIRTDYGTLMRGYHDSEEKESVEPLDLIRAFGLLMALMALGCWGAERIQIWTHVNWGWKNFTFPGYLGSMLLAMLFRNLNDALKLIRIPPQCLDLVSAVSVSLFLTVSMMNLKIWELYGLAVPLLVILVVQTLLVVAITVFALFPAMGGDYDAAIICSGFIGHGLGAPPSAVSMMRAACDQHNLVSYKAFLIVPLCGAALIDIVMIPTILWFIKIFSP